MRTILIIGAGFCGAVTAVQLLRAAGSQALRVVLLNRSGRMARGLAYGTRSPGHTLNVPAGNMSALQDDPDHFLRFAQRIDPHIGPASFVARSIYGDYLESLLDEAANDRRGEARLVRMQGEALSVRPTACGTACEVVLRDGQSMRVAQVLLAFGHFPSNDPPQANPAFYASARYIRDPWNESAVAAIASEAPVLLIGTGLTAIDLALSLLERNPKRQVHMLSRHGLLPQAHRACAQPTALPTLDTVFLQAMGDVRQQLRALRRQLVRDGGDWRATFNALRPLSQALWLALPHAQRQRFLRHLQPYWDNHRHRVAPQVDARVRSALASGALRAQAGRIVRLAQVPAGVEVQLRARGADCDTSVTVGYVVNCTGPSADLRRADNALVRQLLTDGLIQTDRLGLGLELADDGATLDAHGQASTLLYYVGPLLKARYWEATAVPELRRHAAQMAQTLLQAGRSASCERQAPAKEADGRGRGTVVSEK